MKTQVRPIQSGASDVSRSGSVLHRTLDEMLAWQDRNAGPIHSYAVTQAPMVEPKPCERRPAVARISHAAPPSRINTSAIDEVIAKVRQLSVMSWTEGQIGNLDCEETARLAFEVSATLKKEFVKVECFLGYWLMLRVRQGRARGLRGSFLNRSLCG
ncbi:MAG: hypothetical protein K2Q17_00070 [Nitrospiraceae bacterium]|jgi:hypothetical protein|uniref:hypothetical protein n=1 Tax=Nitrospira cf. moscoviensis SBR1015 TaxID=96242 RepID=UPI000A0DB50F|nr:hypothetical protein [Nitrospira cf. moscoviensis SBR1015]MBY0246030.1 hypothetical protein [Nitrospiraceae bacterium]OQW34037.1 MAG: hypothetical protein A4E20_18200 [Nitrospira sp. SG-bin2]